MSEQEYRLLYEGIQNIQIKIEGVLTRQTENHAMNKEDIATLFKKLGMVENKIKCDLNEQRIADLKKDFRFVYFFLGTVVVGGIVLGIWVKSFLGT